MTRERGVGNSVGTRRARIRSASAGMRPAQRVMAAATAMAALGGTIALTGFLAPAAGKESAKTTTPAASASPPTAGATTLFSDDFSNGLPHWSKSGGSWTVSAGAMQQTKIASTSARLFAGSTDWTNYALEVGVQPLAKRGAHGYAGVAVRATGSSSYVRLVLSPNGQASIQVLRGGRTTTIASAAAPAAMGSWHTLRLEVSGTSVRGFVDRALIGAGTGRFAGAGRIGLLTGSMSAAFRGVEVASLSGPAAPTAAPTMSSSPAPTPSSVPPTASTPTPKPTAPKTTAPTPKTPTTPATAPTAKPVAAGWNPPSTLSAPLDKVWNHMETTYSDLDGFKNYIWDQVIAGKGNINYCVRWDSTASVTATQRDQIQATLAGQFQKWIVAMNDNGTGWNGFPYQKVNVKVVGWAVRDRAQLKWTDDSVDIYVNDINENAPQCGEPCGRFFHQDNNYPGCPGGSGHHYDMSLWLTQGFGADGEADGAGGDWGQRMSTEYFLANLNSANLEILLHEMGHGYGLDDFYDWDPGVGGFLMMAGSADHVTAFDQWMARDFWRHVKGRYGL